MRVSKSTRTERGAGSLLDAQDLPEPPRGTCVRTQNTLRDYIRNPNLLTTLGGRTLRIVAGRLIARIKELEAERGRA